MADFSENYSFVLQDAAQGFHSNNLQATIHPFVAYYMKSGELHHLSYVIISDCLHHDTVAVHLFQKHFIEYLKRQFCSLPCKFFYASDGAASQYKNRKNFINLCHHEEDFGVASCWVALFCNLSWKGGMWRSWWYSEEIGCKTQPSTFLWSADNDTTPVVWLGRW